MVKKSHMPSKDIKRVLVANRGEIAARIARTLNSEGICSVALFIEAEKNAPYLKDFQEIYLLNPNHLAAFLDMDAILKIAHDQNIDAIHPGYGFLSENPIFAKKVVDAQLIWIGPPAKVIGVLGNKEQAKALARKCEVPVLDNVFEEKEDDLNFVSSLKKLSLPLIIKPLMGGGGKGMQILHDTKSLDQALQESRSIARKAFGDGRLLAETYIQDPKHIEIQMVRDAFGHCYALGERDCTVQRRHQKIIEECPSIILADDQRVQICADAQKLLDHADYTSVGTVEFLLDASGQHYFMEVNTRLQVEHVVTEMVYDVDLVRIQIDIAKGLEVNLCQQKPQGHAIEVRVYAENPDQDFLPAGGIFSHVQLPEEHKALRVDHNVCVGQSITPMFDPMILKLSVWAETRHQAITNLLAALKDLRLVGVKTNQTYLAWVLDHPDFIEHHHHTQWASKQLPAYQKNRERNLAHALHLCQTYRWQEYASLWKDDPWNVFTPSDHETALPMVWQRKEIKALLKDIVSKAQLDASSVYRLGPHYWVYSGSELYVLSKKDPSTDREADPLETSLNAPMTGTIIKVHVQDGTPVAQNDVLIEMEAMKMQYKLKSPNEGLVASLSCKEGDVVSQDQLLLRVDVQGNTKTDS